MHQDKATGMEAHYVEETSSELGAELARVIVGGILSFFCQTVNAALRQESK